VPSTFSEPSFQSYPHTSRSECLSVRAGLADVSDPRASTAQNSSTDFASCQLGGGSSMDESRLFQSSNKSFTISGLTQSYHDSMENAISRWVTEENCPYERMRLVSKRRSPSETPFPSSFGKILYLRVRQLDAALSSVRRTPLTTAENAGASRALKLAIIAFASQWSHSPQAPYSGKPAVLNVPSSLVSPNEDMGESYEFECLIRQGL
jgi:hypothetical protein